VFGQNITTDFFYPEKGNKNHKKGDEENNVGEDGGVASRPQGSEAPSRPSTSKPTSFAEQRRGNNRKDNRKASVNLDEKSHGCSE